MDHKALLLIDLQNDYYPGGNFELAGIDQASATAAALLAQFRDQGRHVVHVRHEFPTADAPFFRPGSAGAERTFRVGEPIPSEAA